MDIATPGIGTPFEFTRHYDTSTLPRTGILGRGWSHTYDAMLTSAADGTVLYRSGDGQQLTFAPDGSGGYTGPTGVRSTLSGDSTAGWTLTRNDFSQLSFDPAGQLIGMHDRHGLGLGLAHTNGQLTQVTDEAGRTVSLAYHPDGHLAGVSTDDGRSVSYAYDGDDLIAFTDVRGQTWQYTYDTDGRMTTELDPEGDRLIRTGYGPDGRVVEQYDAFDNRTTFTWDAATGTATMTDPQGGQWVDVYHDNVLIAQTDPLGNTTQYQYDDLLRLRTRIDPLGRGTSFEYDAAGNVIRMTPPLGMYHEYRYTPHNDMRMHTEPLGHRTTWTYDTAGDLVRQVRPDGGTTTYQPDPSTHLLTVETDDAGNTTTYAYDPSGNLIELVGPDGTTTTPHVPARPRPRRVHRRSHRRPLPAD